MPSFEYEPLILAPKPQTSNEEEDRRDINGARPLGIGIPQEPGDLQGKKDSLEKEDAEQTLKQVKKFAGSSLSRVCICSFRNRGQIQPKEHIMQEDH